MRFTPLTEEEIEAQRKQVQEGIADFEIIEAEEQTSKAGNEMISLKVQVWDKDGTSGIIFDYLVSHVQWKIKGLCDAIGLPDMYQHGQLDCSALIGKAGKCLLKIQKDKTGKYPDRLRIQEYIKEEEKKLDNNKDVTKQNKKEDEPFDDDIPF